MSSYLDGLNPPQRDAVLHTQGPLLVLAGAGSGKTRVITRRITHLIHSGLAAPHEILAVTFTNKAAAEMRERVAELIGPAARQVRLATFHAYGLQVLRRHHAAAGLRKNFTIASEADARTILRRIVDDLGKRGPAFSPAQFQNLISLAKNRCAPPEDLPKDPVLRENTVKYLDRLSEIYARYDSALRAANTVDFDDLLLLTLRLWREHPRILAECRNAFRHVSVDEFQDTNAVQYELLRLLTQDHRNLCVVGDDDQSIYAWRGATPRNILEFERDFPGAKIITLDQNYRSTETILKAANAVIGNNHARRAKNLWSTLGKGRAIDWFIVANEEAEAAEAVRWIQSIRAKTRAPWHDFALLYRSNIQSKPFEIAFRQAEIPYAVYGGQDFFERAEVKDLIAYLKAIVNPRDEPAVLRIINMPRRGIGDSTLHRAHERCQKENCGIAEALRRMVADAHAATMPLFTEPAADPAAPTHERAEQGIKSFLSLLQRFRREFGAPGADLRAVTLALLQAIDYRGELERSARTPAQAEARWQNVAFVLDALAQYQAATDHPTLHGFLDRTHLNQDNTPDREERRREGVSLMTIHSAKGLEFPFVFLVGCEEGLLPHANSLRDGTLDEERRLFYVALTRAQRHLTLFQCLSRTRQGAEKTAEPSRFLREIPDSLLHQQIRAVRMDPPRENTAPDATPAPKRRAKPHAQ